MNFYARCITILFTIVLLTRLVNADSVKIPIHKLSESGIGEQIGYVVADDFPYGLQLTPFLEGLTPGHHGFHIHQNPDCSPKEKGGKIVAGLSAGGHYDPAGTGKHLGPYEDGHLGDLPALSVDIEGKASTPVLAPRVKVSDLKGRSLMIHAGEDNYSDVPRKLGGGGSRFACGVVP